MNVALTNFDTQQVAAIDAVAAWLKHRTDEQQFFRLFGYAGTGKTTIALHLAGLLDGPVVFAAYTGKAALMMERKGCKDASTIHSLIYKPRHYSNGNVRFELDPDSLAASAALIVVDECSMLDNEIARDLMSFGKPILGLAILHISTFHYKSRRTDQADRRKTDQGDCRYTRALRLLPRACPAATRGMGDEHEEDPQSLQ